MESPGQMPSRLGRYVVRRRIGSGGFATVWLAYDEQLDSPVAVKVLGDIWTEDHQIRQRFVEEGRFLRRVESPYVVSVYDAGELADGRPYLVMSYADQGTLADRLEIDGLTVPQAMEVIRQVGAGLQALHDRDVLHRDVKPANVLFRTVTGTSSSVATDPVVRAMLGDLGLGKALDVSSRLTMVAGTPTFVAPEQAAAESPDARADQYSLAALAYLLLAGRPPFSHTSLSEAMHPAPVPSASTPERPLPAEADAVLHRGLEPDRQLRYPDVTAFVTALGAALGPALTSGASSIVSLPRDPELTQPGPRPTQAPDAVGTVDAGSRPRRRRRGLVIGTVIGLLALVVGAGAGYAAQRSRHPDHSISDGTGSLEVTVPGTWEQAVSRGQWRPPGAKNDYPALSVGSARDWTDVHSRQQGVFVALLPAKGLPTQLPQHPECAAGQSTRGGPTRQATMTEVWTGCPGGVTVERAVQVADDLTLWVQIRSHDRATASQVLDSVVTHGL